MSWQKHTGGMVPENARVRCTFDVAPGKENTVEGVFVGWCASGTELALRNDWGLIDLVGGINWSAKGEIWKDE